MGRDAGRLVLSAPTAVVESEIVATVYDGARQTQARAAGTDGYGQSQLAVARAGGLALGNGALGRVNVFNTDVRLGRYADITLAMAAGDALAAERVGIAVAGQRAAVRHGPGRTGSGDRRRADGGPGGGAGRRRARGADGGPDRCTGWHHGAGGAITLSNTFVSPDASVKARALSKAGEAPAIVTRGRGAGRERPLGGPARQGVASPWLGRLDGGRVTLDSPHGIAVAAGSLIDVFGRRGAHRGETRAGKGGDVTRAARRKWRAPRRAGAGGAGAAHGGGGGTLTLETDGRW